MAPRSASASASRQSAIQETALQLRRVLFAMKGRFRGALSDAGLTFSQWVVLKQLRKQPQLTSREVADCLDCTPANATGIIDRLERDGLVERSRSDSDRRVVHIRLTTRGSAKFDEVVGRAPRALDDMFEGWSTRDLAEFQRALARLNLRPEDDADF